MDAIVFDLETTGLTPYVADIIQIGAVYSTAEEPVKATFSVNVMPQVLKVSRDLLTNSDHPWERTLNSKNMRDSVDTVTARAMFESFILEHMGSLYKSVLVGHRVTTFDLRFLKGDTESDHVKWMTPNYLDTRSMATLLHHVGRGPKNTGSSFLFRHYNAEPPEELRHTALGDAVATAHVFQAQLKELA